MNVVPPVTYERMRRVRSAHVVLLLNLHRAVTPYPMPHDALRNMTWPTSLIPVREPKISPICASDSHICRNNIILAAKHSYPETRSHNSALTELTASVAARLVGLWSGAPRAAAPSALVAVTLHSAQRWSHCHPFHQVEAFAPETLPRLLDLSSLEAILLSMAVICHFRAGQPAKIHRMLRGWHSNMSLIRPCRVGACDKTYG